MQQLQKNLVVRINYRNPRGVHTFSASFAAASISPSYTGKVPLLERILSSVAITVPICLLMASDVAGRQTLRQAANTLPARMPAITDLREIVGRTSS